MKEVRAIVRPARLAKLREALREIPNFPGVTMFKAEGFTAPASIAAHSIRDELADFTAKLVVSVICSDEMAPVIRDVIVRASQTGQVGDGLVWIIPIDNVFRIRDGTSLSH